MLALCLQLPTAAAAALAVIAVAKVRGRSELAALLFATGGTLEAGYNLAVTFLGDLVPLWWVAPLAQVGAGGCVCLGLVFQLNELNPPRRRALPPEIARLRDISPKTSKYVLLGVGGLAAIGLTSRLAPSMALAAEVAAVAVALGCSRWVDRRSDPALWALERRPDLIVWTFAHCLTVVDRETGAQSTRWTVRLGLSSGLLLELPAAGQSEAKGLVAAVTRLCPGISVGHSADQAARFRAAPPLLRI